jgi:hypothetical protein
LLNASNRISLWTTRFLNKLPMGAKEDVLGPSNSNNRALEAAGDSRRFGRE